jgi:threonine aldolase
MRSKQNPLVYTKFFTFSWAPAYGTDTVTEHAIFLMLNEFGITADRIFPVWNGTAANVLGLRACLKPHQSIICTSVAHIHLDECGAPEQHTGSKLIPIETPDAKLTPELIAPHFQRMGDVQAVQPKVISISQSTEYGTIYSLQEIKALADFAHSKNAYLHMDGARAANAAASLNCSLKAMTKDAGVDVLSFGGTKNGLMGAEAVVFLNPALGEDFKYIRKQGLHLASKMRFISAQFIAYFENELWRTNATQANQMAMLMESELKKFPDKIQITQKVEANAVFAIMPSEMAKELQKEFYFYVWNELTNEVRLMCSFETTEEQIQLFSAAIKNYKFSRDW